jgi:hypothetical protein
MSISFSTGLRYIGAFCPELYGLVFLKFFANVGIIGVNLG